MIFPNYAARAMRKEYDSSGNPTGNFLNSDWSNVVWAKPGSLVTNLANFDGAFYSYVPQFPLGEDSQPDLYGYVPATSFERARIAPVAYTPGSNEGTWSIPVPADSSRNTLVYFHVPLNVSVEKLRAINIQIKAGRNE